MGRRQTAALDRSDVGSNKENEAGGNDRLPNGQLTCETNLGQTSSAHFPCIHIHYIDLQSHQSRLSTCLSPKRTNIIDRHRRNHRMTSNYPTSKHPGPAIASAAVKQGLNSSNVSFADMPKHHLNSRSFPPVVRNLAI
jgi:hypothetical protein